MFQCCILSLVQQWEDDRGEFYGFHRGSHYAGLTPFPTFCDYLRLSLLFQVWPVRQLAACHFLICARTSFLRLSQCITFRFMTFLEWTPGTILSRLETNRAGHVVICGFNSQHSSLLGNSFQSRFIINKTNIRRYSVPVLCLTEFPKPQLGEPRDLSALRMQPAQEDVLTVSQTLDKLLAQDTVQVELIPEKKGLFLKHVEYQVTSQARHPIHCTPFRLFC